MALGVAEGSARNSEACPFLRVLSGEVLGALVQPELTRDRVHLGYRAPATQPLSDLRSRPMWVELAHNRQLLLGPEAPVHLEASLVAVVVSAKSSL